MGIAFEGALGDRIDAVLAVAMLNGFAAKEEARRISLSISRSSLKTAQLAAVLAEFYATQPAGVFATIGMPDGAPPSDDAPVLAATLSRKAADGTPLYTTNIGGLLDTADNSVLIRNVLLAQNDGNASVVIAGAATGLARLLDLYGSRPQIVVKPPHAGCLPTGRRH
jgi:hypothetical protein